MEKGFYHPSVGYWQTLSNPTDEVRLGYPAGTIEVPLKPSALHTFDGVQWVEPTQAELDEAAAQEVRAERDVKLATEVDAIAGNALRWAALDSATQAEWATYRQALLDVPQQSGFPHSVVWPTKPD